MNPLFRLTGQGLSLSALRRPKSWPALVDFNVFFGACLISLLSFALQDRWLSEPPIQAYLPSLGLHAGYFFSVLVVAWLAATLVRRPALWLSLASLMVIGSVPWMLLWQQLPEWWPDPDAPFLAVASALIGFILWAVLLRTLGFLARDAGAPRRWFVSALCWVLLAWPWQIRQDAWFWYPIDQEEIETPEQGPVSVPGFDSEGLIARQSLLLDRAVRALKPHSPGKTELFAIGFAGDGGEDVFRNEVEYFDRLMSQRFDAEGRSLSLINNPNTLTSVPLATRANLSSALSAVAGRMDTDEDLLVLFLTSHGSADHRLAVDMAPLALEQIDPEYLRTTLDKAGIRWRVIIVSACYSGGFVDALRDPRTLVITAARADRTSFGCGSDSKITWFGKAFLTDALNRTVDFEQAFAIASKRVREWELAEGETASVPQIAAGELIGTKLREWSATLAFSEPVPFVPATDSRPKTGAL